jgi:hypothetical protein
MDPATRERIFEPFFSTKGPAGGTGMGPAVVHGVVGSHGGWIRLESALGRGTTFTLGFPQITGPAEAPPEPPAPRRAVDRDLGTAGERRRCEVGEPTCPIRWLSARKAHAWPSTAVSGGRAVARSAG